MSNPYTLVFGQQPREMISRIVQEKRVLQTFQTEPPSQQVYMITGMRGVGKTVFMTSVSNIIRLKDDWITVELNPERDLLQSLASKLCSDHTLAVSFQSASINLSFFGFGLEVKGTAPITDIETALERMLQTLEAKGKKILITIDEVSDTENMRIFASSFQIFVRKSLPVFLLMTGLYENISELQNEKSLTFLYRAPKIELRSLNIGTVAENYRRNFSLTPEDARKMAQLTVGYSFAFQVLGYLTWENHGDFRGIKNEYQQYLEDYVYEKAWSEMSAKDRQVCIAIARESSGKIAEIRRLLNMNTNQFNPYRDRLKKKGILDGETYGYVFFTLPLFREFILSRVDDGE